MTTKHTFALLLILCALFSAACGGDSSPTAPTPPAAAAPAPPPPPPPAPLWTRSGSGPNVLDKPITVTRIRIVGDYSGRGENFVVWCGNSLLVNVILGTGPAASAVHYDGTHLATACTTVEVKFSLNLPWSLTEVR